jgi:hypothetical protein
MNIRCAATLTSRGRLGGPVMERSGPSSAIVGIGRHAVESDPPVAEGGGKRRARCGADGVAGRVSMAGVKYGYQYGRGRVEVVRRWN